MSSTDPKRVLIVDDHPLFREALEVAMQRAAGPGVTAEHCATLEAATDAVRQEGPALILLDLNLADSTGFDGLIRLQSVDRETPIAVVSATESPAVYAKARTLGARGYLPKSVGLETLSSALKTILEGGEWFPEAEANDDADHETDETAIRISSLTPAQRRVLDGLSDGLLNKQIAYEMGISEATVKAHMTAIFRKLGVNNRTQALLMLKSATSVDDHSAA